jgi:hypothetical protein
MKKKKYNIHKHTAIADITDFKSYLNSIESVTLKDVTQNLKNNLDILDSSLILPVMLVQRGVNKVDFLERFRTAYSNIKPQERNKDTIEQEMNRLDEERKMSDIDHTLEILDEMIGEDNQVSNTLENMFRLNTLHLWTLFEVYCQDIWKCCVNAYPESLGKGAFEYKKEKCTSRIIKEFTENQFTINYKDSLGDFLAEFIDFSGVRDVTKAFKNAFGTSFKPIENKLLENIDLINLQSLRNQIIHKSGIVDAQFLAKTNNLEYNIGDVIEIDGVFFEKIYVSVTKAIWILTEYVEKNLNEKQ